MDPKMNDLHETRCSIEAKLGRGYQPEYLDFLASQIIETVLDWLKNHNAPEEVIDLISMGDYLARNISGAKANDLEDHEAQNIAEMVPEATRFIWKLGGTFSNSYNEIRGKDPLLWKG